MTLGSWMHSIVKKYNFTFCVLGGGFGFVDVTQQRQMPMDRGWYPTAGEPENKQGRSRIKDREIGTNSKLWFR